MRGNRLVWGVVALGWAAWSTLALAKDASPKPLEQRVVRARRLLVDGNLPRAEQVLAGTLKRGPEQPVIVPPDALAQIWYLQGAWRIKSGLPVDSAATDFRRALAIMPALEWDAELLGEGDEWRFFEALRGEVGARQRVSPGLPEKHGAVLAYLDGVPLTPDLMVLPGRHLAQVRCPEGEVAGAWVDLPKVPKWLRMCGSKIALDALPPAPDGGGPGDAEFGDLDVFGAGPAEGDDEDAADAPAEPDPS